MGSNSSNKPHVVCIPYPAQGHITPIFNFSKLLYSHGFRVTFVLNHYNYNRLVKSQGAAALSGLPDFQFEAIDDGQPPAENDNVTQDVPALCRSSMTGVLNPFVRELLVKLTTPGVGFCPVTRIITDANMTFALDVAKEFNITALVFKTTSACGLMGYLQYHEFVKRGLVPLKDESDLSNGYLDTPIDWVPGMKNMRFRDFPSFVQTVDKDDTMFNFFHHQSQRYALSSGIIMNTFEELESAVLEELSKVLPPIYTIGPLQLLVPQFPTNPPLNMGSNLWEEEVECLQWLHNKEPSSVVYVNFGSITVMTNQQLVEFAWGLANSGYDFLWIIRSDLVKGEAQALPEEFLEVTKSRGFLGSWCPQEKVLGSPAIGGFLTHSGWNSTLDTICGGVPVLSWPFFAEQQTNCRYQCTEWGTGMEIDNDVKREMVEGLIRELMGGEKGKEMKRRALKWKESAIRATQPGGSSFQNLKKLVNELAREGSLGE